MNFTFIKYLNFILIVFFTFSLCVSWFSIWFSGGWFWPPKDIFFISHQKCNGFELRSTAHRNRKAPGLGFEIHECYCIQILLTFWHSFDIYYYYRLTKLWLTWILVVCLHCKCLQGITGTLQGNLSAGISNLWGLHVYLQSL